MAQLSGTRSVSLPAPPAALGHLSLPWRQEATIRVLGYQTRNEARPAKAKPDEQTLAHQVRSFYRMCDLEPEKRYIVIAAVRFALEQVIYLNPIIDTDYEALGKRTF